MNNYWVRIHRTAGDTPGMLSREQDLSRLKNIRRELDSELRLLEQAGTRMNELIDAGEQNSRHLTVQLNRQQDTAGTAIAQYTELKHGLSKRLPGEGR